MSKDINLNVTAILKDHLEKVQAQANPLYLQQLKKMINKLENNSYIGYYELVDDLASMGFVDLANKISK